MPSIGFGGAVEPAVVVHAEAEGLADLLQPQSAGKDAIARTMSPGFMRPLRGVRFAGRPQPLSVNRRALQPARTGG